MLERTPLFEKLRQATHLAHRRLEHRVDIYRPSFAVHNYRRLLQDLWGFYRPLERKLVVLADHIFPSRYSQRWLKAPRLAQDLLSLGMTEADIAALPLCGRLPALPTLPQAFGVQYVIECATLGERIDGLHVRETFGIDPSLGGSFFSSYDPRMDLYRQEFETVMTTAVGEPGPQTLAIEAAIDTFDCFEAWLDYRLRPQRASSSQWNVGNVESEPELDNALHFDSFSGATITAQSVESSSTPGSVKAQQCS